MPMPNHAQAKRWHVFSFLEAGDVTFKHLNSHYNIAPPPSIDPLLHQFEWHDIAKFLKEIQLPTASCVTSCVHGVHTLIYSI
jgi:hypothetical protein